MGLVKQVLDDFLAKPYSVNDMFRKSDQLTPEECVAAELCEKWKKRLRDLNIPQKCIYMNIDRLKLLCDEIESFEKERVAIGEPFTMLTPRIKWLIEQLLEAPWHTSLAYQQVHDTKNSFFKVVSGPDMQFVKVTSQDPKFLFEDNRTKQEVFRALERFNAPKQIYEKQSAAQRLSSLQNLENQDVHTLRMKMKSGERSKLSNQETLTVYKVVINDIYRRKLKMLRKKEHNSKPKIATPEREMVTNFEADLLADSSPSAGSRAHEDPLDDKEDYDEYRKMMGLDEEQKQEPKRQVKKIKQLRVVQIEKDPNGYFVSREMFVYGDEIAKYYAFCAANPGGGYIRVPLSTDKDEEEIGPRKGRPKKTDLLVRRREISPRHGFRARTTHCTLSINRHHDGARTCRNSWSPRKRPSPKRTPLAAGVSASANPASSSDPFHLASHDSEITDLERVRPGRPPRRPQRPPRPRGPVQPTAAHRPELKNPPPKRPRIIDLDD